MKQTVLALSILFIASSAAAVVGSPEPGENEMSITGGTSASATTAAGPDGTAYTSTVEMEGRESNVTEEKMENISYSGNETRFAGLIQAPTPCHTLNQKTRETSSSEYIIDIGTEKQNSSRQCKQQVVMIRYSGSFRAETPYILEISHDNRTIRKDIGPVVEETEPSPRPMPGPERQGVLESIISSIKDFLGLGPEPVTYRGEENIQLEETGDGAFKLENAE